MKYEIAKLWADTLSSGKYEQIRGYLKTNKGYCCLGVLCELAKEHGVPIKELKYYKFDLDKDIYTIDGELRYLPESVQVWAGIKTSEGLIPYTQKYLWQYNDNNHTFDDIADIIMEYWTTI